MYDKRFKLRKNGREVVVEDATPIDETVIGGYYGNIGKGISGSNIKANLKGISQEEVKLIYNVWKSAQSVKMAPEQSYTEVTHAFLKDFIFISAYNAKLTYKEKLWGIFVKLYNNG